VDDPDHPDLTDAFALVAEGVTLEPSLLAGRPC
jgi:hypothetical protein